MLLEFYGDKCGHCENMKPMVEKFENETGLKIEKLEVWNDDENAKKLEQYDKGLCGGVPFFFNTDTNDFICGETSCEKLKEWAS